MRLAAVPRVAVGLCGLLALAAWFLPWFNEGSGASALTGSYGDPLHFPEQYLIAAFVLAWPTLGVLLAVVAPWGNVGWVRVISGMGTALTIPLVLVGLANIGSKGWLTFDMKFGLILELFAFGVAAILAWCAPRAAQPT